MAPIDPRDFGKLEAKVDHLSQQVEEMAGTLQAVRTVLDQTKGGWYVLATAASISGAVAALAVKMLPFWPFR
jgi:hypothetical protein